MKTIRTSLATLTMAALMTTAYAKTQYSGTWELSGGYGGTVTMDVNGSLISGVLRNLGPVTIIGVPETATLEGSISGRRFKVLIVYPNGARSWFQGNVEVDSSRLWMSGLRYMNEKPDVKTRFTLNATRMS